MRISTEYVPRLAFDHAGAGELLVLLHGIGGNRTNWRGQMAVFAEHFHVVALDARGYGMSDDYEGPLVFARYADDVLRVLEHFDARRAHVLGLSMGGNIAMDFAIRNPNRVKSLVLCDTDRGGHTFTPEEKRKFLELRLNPLLSGAEPADIALSVAKSLVARNATPQAVEQLVASMSALHKESYIKNLHAILDFDVTRTVRQIVAPTLVIVGNEDPITPVAEAQGIANEVAGAELVVIPGAGHLTNIEMPVEFNRAVLSFLLRQKD